MAKKPSPTHRRSLGMWSKRIFLYRWASEAYVLEAAARAYVDEVQITTARIKSITKDGDKITLEFDGFAEIGSLKTQYMEQEVTYFEPRKEGEVRLIDLPEDSKEIRIYWGYGVSNFRKILAFEKIR